MLKQKIKKTRKICLTLFIFNELAQQTFCYIKTFLREKVLFINVFQGLHQAQLVTKTRKRVAYNPTLWPNSDNTNHRCKSKIHIDAETSYFCLCTIIFITCTKAFWHQIQ